MMRKYYLHITNGHIQTEDREGQEFTDFAAAREEAISGIRSLISEDVLHGKLNMRGNIAIHDERNGRIESIPFKDAVKIEHGLDFGIEKSDSGNYARK